MADNSKTVQAVPFDIETVLHMLEALSTEGLTFHNTESGFHAAVCRLNEPGGLLAPGAGWSKMTLQQVVAAASNLGLVSLSVERNEYPSWQLTATALAYLDERRRSKLVPDSTKFVVDTVLSMLYVSEKTQKQLKSVVHKLDWPTLLDRITIRFSLGRRSGHTSAIPLIHERAGHPSTLFVVGNADQARHLDSFLRSRRCHGATSVLSINGDAFIDRLLGLDVSMAIVDGASGISAERLNRFLWVLRENMMVHDVRHVVLLG